MNFDSLVSWGRKAREFLAHPQAVTAEAVDCEILTKKLGWLREYGEALEEWSEWLAVVQAAEGYVRREGFHAHAVAELQRELIPLATGLVAGELCGELLAFVGEQSAQARPGERLLGSSEVIESVIGKYKRLQGTHSQGGMTAMLLSIGAIVASKTTGMVRDALTATPTRNVLEWCHRHLGITLQAQRCLAFSGNKTGIQTGPHQDLSF